ncbi:SAM-dependent methyltransferase, MidA family [Mariprofundus ferrinatatus]|uniref:SAM-dependent methyltransferase, MidA family n=1 Tax=Mariprofundus ferrinatatus TaxID=1921087 RepID=A0A2K8L341_9PROT|nr:SAM-dependent methyltransferase [Mariprofundus ferrinatatus]ATX81673.1 SAM-dependent methyltransferase, MidA family [Mariprofundus ferrinatatus]
MSEHEQLEQIIRERIGEAGNFLTFDRFMQAALYEPGLGYYESKTVFGEKGDFVTAPELGPWLSLGFADLIFWAWNELGQPAEWTLLEQGSGSGKLLASVLDIISQFSMLSPSSIISVERSAQLRNRQAELFAERNLVVDISSTLDEVEPRENIIVFSNELPDAFPVRCFRWRDGHFYERGVTCSENGFAWKDGDSPLVDGPDISPELINAWQDGYVSEWNPSLEGWQKQLSGIVISGFVFTNDYGYSQQEYYRQGRREGSLLAHIGQQASEDVLSDPGSRDVTAHVDFTALALAGKTVGFSPLLWMSQGGWLAQSPSVQAFVQSLACQNDATSMHLMAHAKRVLMPYGMGEVFKVLVQSKGFQADRPDYLKQFHHLDLLRL